MDKELIRALDDMCDDLGPVHLDDVLADPESYIYNPDSLQE